MEIIKKIVRTATHKGRTLKFIYVKLEDEKWYELKPTYSGYYVFKEVKNGDINFKLV